MKKKIIILSIITIIIILATTPFTVKFLKEYKFNQEIVNCMADVVELENIENLDLWDSTIESLKRSEKGIEIKKDDYTIKLLVDNLTEQNNFNVKVEGKISEHEEFKDLNIVEINLENTENNKIEYIDLNNDKFFKDLKFIDIYAINNDGNLEYLETKEITNVKADEATEENLDENVQKTTRLEIKEDYKKYILVYVPVSDIEVEQELNLNKGEKHELKIAIKPENATCKKLNISSKDTIKITEGKDENSANKTITLEVTSVGKEKITLKAENEDISKTITVTTKAKVEKINVEKSSFTIIEGKTATIKATVLPKDVDDTTVKFESSDEKVATVNDKGVIKAIKEGKATITVTSNQDKTKSKKVQVTVIEKPKPVEIASTSTLASTTTSTSSLSGLTYIKGILIANKKYSLPSNYNPGLSPKLTSAFNEMKAAAKKDGIKLTIVSGFRSYQFQQSIYGNNVKRYGETRANSFSAKPGQSEHQTGLAVDLNSTKFSFANTKEAKWIANNCHKYGFIVRYPKGKESITGYVYEPWHVRYLGVETATAVKNSGLCLEEYLGIQ